MVYTKSTTLPNETRKKKKQQQLGATMVYEKSLA